MEEEEGEEEEEEKEEKEVEEEEDKGEEERSGWLKSENHSQRFGNKDLYIYTHWRWVSRSDTLVCART